MRSVKVLYELLSSAQTLEDIIKRNPKGLSTFFQGLRIWLHPKLLLIERRLGLGLVSMDPTPRCNFMWRQKAWKAVETSTFAIHPCSGQAHRTFKVEAQRYPGPTAF